MATNNLLNKVLKSDRFLPVVVTSREHHQVCASKLQCVYNDIYIYHYIYIVFLQFYSPYRAGDIPISMYNWF